MRAMDRPAAVAERATAMAHRHLVLVVEDEPLVREAVGAMMEPEGVAVELATDGEDALRRLRAGLRPCLIVLDLMMPRKDGWEFRVEQRQDPTLADVPVIVFSGHPGGAVRVHSLGVHEFMEKPIDVEALREKLDRLCTQR